eukprot:194505-Chlamydomonas_euryale.AAC.1
MAVGGVKGGVSGAQCEGQAVLRGEGRGVKEGALEVEGGAGTDREDQQTSEGAGGGRGRRNWWRARAQKLVAGAGAETSGAHGRRNWWRARGQLLVLLRSGQNKREK